MELISWNPGKWYFVHEYRDLEKLYGEEYAEKYKNSVKSGYYKSEVREKRLKFVEKFLPIEKCFDFGCSVNPLSLNSLYNYDKYAKGFTTFDREKFNKAEGIMCFDVLEHMLDPGLFLDLLPQKYLFVTIPIYPGPLETQNEILFSNFKHLKIGEHCSYFTNEGFKEFAHRSGWNLEYEGMDECPPREHIKSYVFSR